MIRRGNGSWRNTSKFHYLSDEEIIQALELGSELQRACQLDKTSRLAVLRIDSESGLHNEEGISKILTAFGDVANSIHPVQFADDWYFYFFFSETIQLDAANKWILSSLEASSICLDGVSVYQVGECLLLPLQPGFAWLNTLGQVIVRREEISFESALALFMHDLNKNALSAETILTVPQMDSDICQQHLELQVYCEEPAASSFEPPAEPLATLHDEREPSFHPGETSSDNEDMPGRFIQLAISMDLKPRVSEGKPTRAPPRNIRNHVSRRAAPIVDERSPRGSL